MNRNRILAFIAVAITIGATKAQEAIDLWNLPPLSIEQGRYTTDWDNLSRQYNTPAWWREAKLGAWSHWDPQSAAEDGDWYSRGMYMEGHPRSKFHREHFGHPSEYGYKELCRDWKTDLWDSQVDLGIDMGLGRLTPQIFLQLFFIKRMIFAELSLHL